MYTHKIKVKKMKSITVLGALAAIALTTSVQANQDVSGFYLGGGAGNTDARAEVNSDSVSIPTDGTTLKLIGGYQFNRIVAIEAQFTSYGDIKFAPNYKWSPKSISLAANLGYTFENGLRPFGVIGLSALKTGESISTNLDDDYAALRFGAGLEYTPAALGGVSFRAGYEADAFTVSSSSSSLSSDDANALVSSVYFAASYKF